MHSSAQGVFSLNGSLTGNRIAMLDTMSGLAVNAAPLQVDLVEYDGLGAIVSRQPVNFLLWPQGYLQLDLDATSEIHVTEFADSVVVSDLNNDLGTATDLGEFIRALAVGDHGPALVPGTAGWTDKVYTAAADMRVQHKPTLRYVVLWCQSPAKAGGAYRAFQSSSSVPTSVRPNRAAYNYHSA